MNALPEVTEEELSLLKKMKGVDLHEVICCLQREPASADQVELAESLVNRGLVFEFNDGRGRAWCLTHIGHDVIRQAR